MVSLNYLENNAVDLVVVAELWDSNSNLPLLNYSWCNLYSFDSD